MKESKKRVIKRLKRTVIHELKHGDGVVEQIEYKFDGIKFRAHFHGTFTTPEIPWWKHKRD